MKDFSTPTFTTRPPASTRRKKVETPSSSPSPLLLLRSLFILGSLGLFVLVCVHIPAYLNQPLKTVRIYDNQSLSKEEIIQYLEITETETWFDLDPYQLSLRLKRHPWIKEAMVHRSFPLGLNVEIRERKPVAFLKAGDKVLLLDEERQVLQVQPGNSVGNLPVIVLGATAKVKVGDKLDSATLRSAFGLMKLLKKSDVIPLAALSEINISDPLNIQIITIPDGITVKFGFKEFDKKLKKLKLAMKPLRQLRHKIKYIDLRHPDGIVFRKQ